MSRSQIKVTALTAIALMGALWPTTAAAVTVDVYQTMESGTPGDLLTPPIMDSASYGGCNAVLATWDFKYGSQMWVSDLHATPFPEEVLVDGVDRNVPSTQTWRFRNREEEECVKVSFGENEWDAPDHERMTIGCFFTTYQDAPFSNNHDNIEMGGVQSYGVLQTIGNAGNDPPYLRAHSSTAGWVTSVSPQAIKIIPGKTYWVNLHYDGAAGQVKVAVFDPEDGFAQVGEIAVADSVPGSAVRSYAHFGRCSQHGDHPDNDTETYLDHIMIDFTYGTFPLLPTLDTTCADRGGTCCDAGQICVGGSY
ncbi:MAG: hypothetical protein ACK2U9_15495, partial [Anaerolineae bacterium]